MSYNKDKCEVSIIVPFYNTRLVLLDRCIQSLLNQTFKNFEIVIVDDGSKKEFAEYIENSYKNNTKIKILHTVNNGVSEARNIGLRNSKGETICFVDSDDYVAPWMIEDMHNALIESLADICISYLKKVDNLEYSFDRRYSVELYDMEKSKDNSYINEIILRGLNISENKLGFLSCGPCAILVKSELAMKYEFPDNIKYMEDVIWNLKVFNRAKKIIRLNETVYAYYENRNSATHMYNYSVIKERIQSLNEIYKNLPSSKTSLEWYALRVLCNFSIIYYQLGHFGANKRLNIVKVIIESYRITYGEKWKEFFSFSIIKNWDIRYKIKYLLYLTRILPIFYISKEYLELLCVMLKERYKYED